ncbi:MAG: M1 family aminopeptidase [Acidobacteriota bacterium]
MTRGKPHLSRPVLCLTGILLAVLGAHGQRQSPITASELSQAIRNSTLDPDQCYLVRDLAFYRDDIKLYFNDGYLIFSKPVAGERLSAVFAGSEEVADGEILLLPPRPDERKSLAKYAKTPNLDEHFTTAVMTFTDGSARALMDEIAAGGRGRPVPEMGPAMAERWNPVLANLNDSLTQRTVADLLAPVRPGGGFLFAALQSERVGTLDVMYDPLSDDQIMLGQLVERNGWVAYDVWTSFPARAVRLGSTPAYERPFLVSSYVISASVDENLRLTAVTKARITVGKNPIRALAFGISRAEKITAGRMDGLNVELSVQESARGRALRVDENDLVLAVVPESLAPGSTHEIEFEHEGAVIGDRGSGVYSVGARANWYPRAALEFSEYDLEFRYPKDLTLVTPGEVVEDHTDGEWHVTRRRTPVPIRIAGFNLGHYARTTNVTAGLTVDVYGNRGLDPALRPQPRATVVAGPIRPLYRGTPNAGQQTTTIIQTPPAPDPLGRMEAVAADVAESLQFFSSLFGPPPLKTLTVSPMPGTAGQGFPGLIYLSTLSYIEERQRPQNVQDSRQKTFFSDLMVAHEVAHQWWGNVVAVESYQDEWIVEGLAHYSALLWLEKKRGAGALQAELNEFRRDLLMESLDGGTVESFGPLMWGYRLESARDPETWRLITYEKGAWVYHMLHQRLGDKAFLGMLAELRRRFEYKILTTRDLQNLAKEFLKPASDEAMDSFFDSWVRSTGVPAVRLRYSTTGRAPNVRLTGTLELSADSQQSLSTEYSIEIPVEIQYGNAERQVEWVKIGSQTQPFSLQLRQTPTRVALLNGATLATER